MAAERGPSLDAVGNGRAFPGRSYLLEPPFFPTESEFLVYKSIVKSKGMHG